MWTGRSLKPSPVQHERKDKVEWFQRGHLQSRLEQFSTPGSASSICSTAASYPQRALFNEAHTKRPSATSVDGRMTLINPAVLPGVRSGFIWTANRNIFICFTWKPIILYTDFLIRLLLSKSLSIWFCLSLCHLFKAHCSEQLWKADEQWKDKGEF